MRILGFGLAEFRDGTELWAAFTAYGEETRAAYR